MYNGKIMSDRNENILVLPHNTIRIVDAPIQAMIEKYKDPNWDEPIEHTIYKVLTRSCVNLSKYNKLNEEESKIVKESIITDWASYYEIAPKSRIIYDLLDILCNQKFVKNVTILFSDKRAWDPSHKNDYYDGTIDSLEKYLNENNITTIFMDNIELLYLLYKRGNYDINNKTIFLSKLGYNYERNPVLSKLMIKHLFELNVNTDVEIGELALTNFEQETIDFFNNKNK